MWRSLAAVLVFAGGVAAQAAPIDHRPQEDVGLSKVPTVGTSHILVLPHRSGIDVYPTADWEFLQAFYDPEGGPGTFRHYWQVVSNGRYDPIPTLVDPILYPDSCPVPDRSVANCTISYSDFQLVLNGGLAATFRNILTKARDDNDLDLTHFDVNDANGSGPDGYFDGIIAHTDLVSGVAFPLSVFANTMTIDVDGGSLSAGIVALIPPANHEFGHILGFMDLYGGPNMLGLMADVDDTTLAAFSRQQVGWAEVDIPAGGEDLMLELAPVLDGGKLLRVGIGDRYVLIENRAGEHHDLYDSRIHPGIYLYSVDEEQMPNGPLGFLKPDGSNIYLPNEEAPYLTVNLPVDCNLNLTEGSNACVNGTAGAVRNIYHADGTFMDYHLRVWSILEDGTAQIILGAGRSEHWQEPDELPFTSPSDDGGVDPGDGGATDGGSVGGDSSGTGDGFLVAPDGGDPTPRDPRGNVGCLGGSCAAGGLGWWLPLAWILRRRRLR